MNKRLADDLKFCANMNKTLVDHYYNYPEAPEGFPEWSKELQRHLDESAGRFK
jgi:hypothetical protein